ncbi:ankyrin repeat domain-containing protein [Stieleria varia]|uniref:Ankyrin repeat protein n=1 Tax=Stieleria varia TaxID=2528005 RepID=A0A5C6AX53_9BACT|nr:ankyrin repeat domain-containing protein [Stieleria varia]TWU04523.1 Ankyrin repeat protein [Stieleria varia]
MLHKNRLLERLALLVLPVLLCGANLSGAQGELAPLSVESNIVESDAIATPVQQRTLHQRLCELNPNWSDKTPNQDAVAKINAVDDDVALIQAHFSLVIERLETADVGHLTSSQLAQRIANIQSLREYMIAGEFPQNIFVPGRRPVFIDPWGTHCAVGYLIATSGHSELANRINQEHQLDVLCDIKTRGLPQWQTASGLSVAELALIQPHYAFRNFSQSIEYPAEIESLILGDSTAVIEALESGKLNVESRCGGKTLLHFAAAAGDLELAKRLVKQGADLNALSTMGCDEAEIAKAGNHRRFEVRWDAATLVTQVRYSSAMGRVYNSTSGSYVADVLQDFFGGMDGKNALHYATAAPRASGNRPVAYMIHGYGFQKPFGKPSTEISPMQQLKNRRAEVAQWLREQGLE